MKQSKTKLATSELLRSKPLTRGEAFAALKKAGLPQGRRETSARINILMTIPDASNKARDLIADTLVRENLPS